MDDILIAGDEQHKKLLIDNIKTRYELSTIVHAPGELSYFGLIVTQTSDYEVTVHADHKIEKLNEPMISRDRRKNNADKMNEIELDGFRSLNSKISWLGTASSPISAFASSYLQQCIVNSTVSTLLLQISILRKLKKLGTKIKCSKPDKGDHQIKVLCFLMQLSVERMVNLVS